MGDIADVYHRVIMNCIIIVYVPGHAFMAISEKDLARMIHYND